MTCVSSVVVGFLVPMLSCITFLLAWFLCNWCGTSKRRKAKQMHEQLIREKDAFRDQEINSQRAATQRYIEEAAEWKKEVELHKAASDAYKRILEDHNIPYQRQTMLFSGEASNASEILKTTLKD